MKQMTLEQAQKVLKVLQAKDYPTAAEKEAMRQARVAVREAEAGGSKGKADKPKQKVIKRKGSGKKTTKKPASMTAGSLKKDAQRIEEMKKDEKPKEDQKPKEKPKAEPKKEVKRKEPAKEKPKAEPKKISERTVDLKEGVKKKAEANKKAFGRKSEAEVTKAKRKANRSKLAVKDRTEGIKIKGKPKETLLQKAKRFGKKGLKAGAKKLGAAGLAITAFEAGNAAGKVIDKKTGASKWIADKAYALTVKPKMERAEREYQRKVAAMKAKRKKASKTSTPKKVTKPAPSKVAVPQNPKTQPKKTSGNKEYKVYKKNSKQAASFRKNFAAARKAGKTKFTWEGREYNTKVKK